MKLLRRTNKKALYEIYDDKYIKLSCHILVKIHPYTLEIIEYRNRTRRLESNFYGKNFIEEMFKLCNERRDKKDVRE